MLNRILSLLFFITAALACAEPKILTVNPNRLVMVLDVVDFSIMNQVIELEKLAPAVGERQDIFVMVNSPGGMVDPGLIFTNQIDRAKLRGYKVKCFSTVMAASMAFQILAHCSETYALEHAKLLFHPVRIGSSSGFTQADLEYYAAEIKPLEQKMNQTLLEAFRFNLELFAYHYARETMWEASTLAEHSNHIRIVDDIIGIPETYTYRRQRSFIFGNYNLEYIKPESLRIFNQEVN